MGRLLSVALLTNVGICILLLGQQLCHCGLWRRGPAAKLADVGAGGEHHRRVNVWNIGERSVCDSDPFSRPRSTILALISGACVQALVRRGVDERDWAKAMLKISILDAQLSGRTGAPFCACKGVSARVIA